MPFVPFKNSTIHYTDNGKGKAVVFLHGFLENHSMWDAFVETFSKTYRVICIDLLGHGLTPNIGYVHTMEEMAIAVKAVLSQLKLKKYALIGHSMGGYVALAFAEFYPDQVASLTLFYSSAKEDSEEKKNLRLRAIETVKQDAKAFVRITIPSLFRPKNRKVYREEIKHLIDIAQKMSVQGIIAALAGMRERPDREALLHFGPYPVLIICGKRDDRLPLEIMESQLAAPNVVDRLITENGHMGHIEDTEVCIETLDYFLHETI